jgi:hypothetical protein
MLARLSPSAGELDLARFPVDNPTGYDFRQTRHVILWIASVNSQGVELEKLSGEILIQSDASALELGPTDLPKFRKTDHYGMMLDGDQHVFESPHYVGRIASSSYAPPRARPGVPLIVKWLDQKLTSLSKKGVAVARSSGDSRKKELAITDAGRERLQRVNEEVEALLNRAFQKNPKVVGRAGSALTRLLRAITPPKQQRQASPAGWEAKSPNT